MSQLILDIETFALDEAGFYLDDPAAPANYKDPEKIKAYVQDAKAKQLASCALDLDLCRVVAVGYDIPTNGGGPTIALAKNDEEERRLLAGVWFVISRISQIIGFNCLSFDLPVLIRRAQYLGVETCGINLDRYRTPHLDLQDFLCFHGRTKVRSLDFYCRRFGIDVPDQTTGKDIDALVRAGNWLAVGAHCGADVLKTKLLAERVGVLAAMEAAV